MNAITQLPWFEIERVADGVYAITEPGHYEYVRSYLVLGIERAALIDTGTGIDDIRREVKRLTDLSVQVILTHSHWDHIGNAHRFSNVALYDHPAERKRLEDGFPLGSDRLTRLKHTALRIKNFGRPYPATYHPEQFEIPGVRYATTLQDGYEIDLGNRTLHVIHTPGHSPGSISLLDRTNRFLFVGDTFYWGPLSGYPDEFDLILYARTAQQLARLAGHIDRVFPAHNELTLAGRPMSGYDLRRLWDAFKHIENGSAQRKTRQTYLFDTAHFSVEYVEWPNHTQQ